MANAFRNECKLVFGGETYTVKATLALLEEYESRFLNVENKGSSLFYRVAGFLLSKSDKPMTEDEGGEIAFGNGLEQTSAAVSEFFRVAYKTGEEGPGKPEKAASSKSSRS